MAASFISDFRLMWYLDELKKNEFLQFKQLLKQETVQRGLQPIPWAQVKKAKRQDLASLMTQRYGERPAWDLALCIFPKIHRKDLCDKASRESAGEWWAPWESTGDWAQGLQVEPRWGELPRLGEQPHPHLRGREGRWAWSPEAHPQLGPVLGPAPPGRGLWLGTDCSS